MVVVWSSPGRVGEWPHKVMWPMVAGAMLTWPGLGWPVSVSGGAWPPPLHPANINDTDNTTHRKYSQLSSQIVFVHNFACWSTVTPLTTMTQTYSLSCSFSHFPAPLILSISIHHDGIVMLEVLVSNIQVIRHYNCPNCWDRTLLRESTPGWMWDPVAGPRWDQPSLHGQPRANTSKALGPVSGPTTSRYGPNNSISWLSVRIKLLTFWVKTKLLILASSSRSESVK